MQIRGRKITILSYRSVPHSNHFSTIAQRNHDLFFATPLSTDILHQSMESGGGNRGLDLEKELTCSAVPRKPWLDGRNAAGSTRNAQPALPPGGTPYTCPSCRAPVRDTKHSSTIATLLEMFLALSPEKDRSEEEKEEARGKYKPGDDVIPKLEQREKSSRERSEGYELERGGSGKLRGEEGKKKTRKGRGEVARLETSCQQGQ
ncbi:ring finger domain-containing protein [Rutstroemia sp. NJR-2017a BBW]|nr:ring finger domain-containing protein [Rutstroemia sp. NJR-2017a BBW]